SVSIARTPSAPLPTEWQTFKVVHCAIDPAPACSGLTSVLNTARHRLRTRSDGAQAGSSESEGVLRLADKLGVSRVETQATRDILQPTLTEDEKHIVSRPQNPTHAALPAEVGPFVVVLDQIEKCQQRRNRVVSPEREYSRRKGSLPEPGKALFERDPGLKMRRELILEARLELIGVSRPERSEPPFIIEFPSPFRSRIHLKGPSRKAVIARRQNYFL